MHVVFKKMYITCKVCGLLNNQHCLKHKIMTIGWDPLQHLMQVDAASVGYGSGFQILFNAALHNKSFNALKSSLGLMNGLSVDL